MLSKTPEYRAAYWQRWAAAHRKQRPCIRCLAPITSGRRCDSCAHAVCEHCGLRFRLREGKATARFCSLRCNALGHIANLHAHRGIRPRLSDGTRRGGALNIEWRKAVLQRDNFTCQDCGVAEGQLHADHIKPWAAHPELRHDPANGRTLCVSCHRKTPTWGYGTYRYLKRLRQEVLAL